MKCAAGVGMLVDTTAYSFFISGFVKFITNSCLIINEYLAAGGRMLPMDVATDINLSSVVCIANCLASLILVAPLARLETPLK